MYKRQYQGTATGFYVRKGCDRLCKGSTWNPSRHNDPLIRYADILLMYAEAANEYHGRQGRWKPTTKGKRNSTPAIPTLTPAGANITSTLSSRRDATTTSFRAALNKRGAAPARTAHALWIRSLPPARSFSRASPQRRYRRFSSGRQTSS